jgi:hypothetical protein
MPAAMEILLEVLPWLIVVSTGVFFACSSMAYPKRLK